jgi:hypothetical protein
MNDNPDPQLDALFAAARAEAPETARAEYAFETRLLARLRAEQDASLFAWAWRLCPFFAALAIAVAWWSQSTERAEAYSRVATEATPGNEDLLAYMTGDRR